MDNNTGDKVIEYAEDVIAERDALRARLAQTEYEMQARVGALNAVCDMNMKRLAEAEPIIAAVANASPMGTYAHTCTIPKSLMDLARAYQAEHAQPRGSSDDAHEALLPKDKPVSPECYSGYHEHLRFDSVYCPGSYLSAAGTTEPCGCYCHHKQPRGDDGEEG